MGGVVVFGECMVEVSLAGSDAAVIGYAGDVFNTAVYLRRLGTPVSFATALGDGDPFSAGILASMAAEGIGAELVTRLPGRLPGLYVIQPDEQGERSFYFWREHSPFRQFFEIADLGAFKAALTNADLVYLTAIPMAVIGDEGRTALKELLADLAGRGVRIAFDTNYRPSLWPSREAALAAVESVIPYCTLVSASGPDVEALTLRPLDEVAAEWAERGPRVIARADNRTVAVHAEGGVLRLPAPPAVRAVDTTGAGDSFNAGYLSSWLRGGTLEHGVALGQALAARVVQHRGAIIPAAAMP
ncbi:MAG TPA: sugar kinase [Phenylobacterium sp.]|jgi:2-dehydro-3-deoxygluconokinase|nr:sugar kinase [Phenylobacterium sp.]